MKKYLIFLLILVSLTNLYSNSNKFENDKILIYNELKKSQEFAFTMSLIMPGAGHLYCEKVFSGIIFLTLNTSSLAVVYHYGMEKPDTSMLIFGAGLYLVTRILELSDVVSSAKQYNKKLRKKLVIAEDVYISFNNNHSYIGLNWKY